MPKCILANFAAE